MPILVIDFLRRIISLLATSHVAITLMFRSITVCSKLRFPTVKPLSISISQSFSTNSVLRMPEQLKESEVQKGQDPVVAKQWDDDTPTDGKFEDFAAMADKMKIGMMGSLRDNIGVCAACCSSWGTDY